MKVLERQAAGTSTRSASRSSATRAARRTSSGRRSSSRTIVEQARRHRASARAPACSTTRRSSTPRTCATSCSTGARRATSPRRRRRGRSSASCTTRCAAAATRRVRPDRHQGLDHVPPVALVPLGRVPVLHLRVRARRSDPIGRVRRREERDPAGVRRQRRHALAPPRCRHSSTRRGWSRTSRRRACTSSTGCSARSTRGRTSTRARSSQVAQQLGFDRTAVEALSRRTARICSFPVHFDCRVAFCLQRKTWRIADRRTAIPVTSSPRETSSIARDRPDASRLFRDPRAGRLPLCGCLSRVCTFWPGDRARRVGSGAAH